MSGFYAIGRGRAAFAGRPPSLTVMILPIAPAAGQARDVANLKPSSAMRIGR